MNDRNHGSGQTTQRTLAGESAEIELVACEVYPVCSTPAVYEVETLVYDGGGWVYKDLAACEPCASETTEPDPPDESEQARELRRVERMVSSGE